MHPQIERQGRSPAGLERCSHIAEVIGSNPIVPTSISSSSIFLPVFLHCIEIRSAVQCSAFRAYPLSTCVPFVGLSLCRACLSVPRLFPWACVFRLLPCAGPAFKCPSFICVRPFFGFSRASCLSFRAPPFSVGARFSASLLSVLSCSAGYNPPLNLAAASAQPCPGCLSSSPRPPLGLAFPMV